MDTGPQKETPCVLVVEDMESTRDLVVFVLERLGVRVIQAKDGREGWRLAEENRPAVAVIDALLPRMDGFSLCAEIKKNPATAGARIIICSALGARAYARKALESGADLYLEKPFQPETLAKAVREFLSAGS